MVLLKRLSLMRKPVLWHQSLLKMNVLDWRGSYCILLNPHKKKCIEKKGIEKSNPWIILLQSRLSKKTSKFFIVIPVIKKTHRIAVGSISAYVKVIQ